MLVVYLGLVACNVEKMTIDSDNDVSMFSDIDGDGYLSDIDCNDNDSATYPDAIEVCDGIDNNCNSEIDEGVLIDFFADADGDGFGNGAIAILSCSQQEGFVPNGNDCNDAEPAMYPGAIEECDGLDNDCNDIIDDGNNIIVYLDADGDGFGDPNIMDSTCTAGEGYVENNLDCNDQNNTIHPDVDEICDSIDNNCDGLIDNEALDAPQWYRDMDNDGYGDDTNTILSCHIPSGYSIEDGDCNDQNSNVHPFAAEICDEIDQDCDGLTDEGTNITFFEDADGDGFGNFYVYIDTCTPPLGYVANAQDCNDGNPNVSPNALEYCNGYDDNCDTMVDENTSVDVVTWFADVDGDGFGDASVPVQSCQTPPFYVGDNTDCNDGRPNVFPGAIETCTTAYDDDCDNNNNDDGATGCLEYFEDIDGDGYGLSSSSQCLCVPEGGVQSLSDSDCDDTDFAINPSVIENCTTTADDNCNGDTNEAGGAGCTYFYQDYDGDGYGTVDRVCMCEPIGDYEALVDGDCDDTNALYSPAESEICDVNDIDENCDGLADGSDALGAVEWYLDGDGDGYGDSDILQIQCDQPIGYVSVGGDCADTLVDINPGMVESCFTTDDDNCSGSNNDVGAIGCSNFFMDNDEDGYGLANDSQCLCVAQPPYSSVSSGDCDDTQDTVSPGQIETCDLSSIGIPQDENCDGSIDEPNAENCTVYHYDYDGDDFGLGSDSICMCDTDGYYRALIGGDCEDTDASINPDQSNCGLMGDIPKDSASVVISGFQYTGQQTPTAVGGFDYNNDGIMDIAVVDPEYDTQYTDAGALFVFLGPLHSSVDLATGTDADLMFSPEFASETIGKYSGISVGNIDGDAADEIIISGLNHSYVIDDNLQGQVTISNTSSGVTTYAGINEDFTSNVMEAMHIIGDMNADGHIDVLRAEGADRYLYFGDGSGGFTKTSQNFSQYHSYPSITKMNTGIDSNNDGVLEQVGSDRYCNGQYSVTSLCIAEYDVATEQFTERVIEDAGHYEYGHVVVGDLNGDGYDDLVSSDYRFDYYNVFQGILSDAGQVWVFYGSANGITAASEDEADWTAYGYNSGLGFGVDLGVSDVDGDGYDDLLISSYKGSFLYYGPLQTYTDSNGNPRDGHSNDADAIFLNLMYSVTGVGDQNGDGYNDILVGGNCSPLDHNDVYDSSVCGPSSQKQKMYLFLGAEN